MSQSPSKDSLKKIWKSSLKLATLWSKLSRRSRGRGNESRQDTTFSTLQTRMSKGWFCQNTRKLHAIRVLRKTRTTAELLKQTEWKLKLATEMCHQALNHRWEEISRRKKIILDSLLERLLIMKLPRLKLIHSRSRRSLGIVKYQKMDRRGKVSSQGWEMIILWIELNSMLTVMFHKIKIKFRYKMLRQTGQTITVVLDWTVQPWINNICTL